MNNALIACMSMPSGIKLNAIYNYVSSAEKKNLIDSTSNIKDSRVYLFSGKIDSVVHTGVVKHAEDFYNNYDAKVTTEYSIQAQHTWPTVSNGKNCQVLGKPYIGACKFDGAFESLKVILPEGSSLK